MKIKKYLFLILFLTISIYCFSQERTIRGIVTTFDSIPVVNAEVKIKRTKQVFYTDEDGIFQLVCLPDDKLKVSANGFSTNNVKLNENTRMVLVNLNLKASENSSDLAVGYGHIKDADKLNAINSVKIDEKDYSSFSNMYDLFRHKFPGIRVTDNKIFIRGINSTNSGSSGALIVVDGIRVSQSVFGSLNPMNVESIDVLKDASASVYGLQGANGVVLVKTKQGK